MKILKYNCIFLIVLLCQIQSISAENHVGVMLEISPQDYGRKDMEIHVYDAQSDETLIILNIRDRKVLFFGARETAINRRKNNVLSIFGLNEVSVDLSQSFKLYRVSSTSVEKIDAQTVRKPDLQVIDMRIGHDLEFKYYVVIK